MTPKERVIAAMYAGLVLVMLAGMVYISPDLATNDFVSNAEALRRPAVLPLFTIGAATQVVGWAWLIHTGAIYADD